MKQLVLFAGCAVVLAGLVGCQGLSGNKSGVEVIIEGDGEFPESLAGVWKADKGVWEFVFEPDGTLSSAVTSLGSVRMKPGEVTTVPLKMGGKGIFEPGDWFVQYSPDRRELVVEIFLKHFYTELGEGILEGKRTDIFIGTVSEDGREWSAEWFNFPEYIVHTQEHQNYKLPYDANENPRDTLIFQKVTE